ncbi:probable Ankyrin-3 [Coccomyxa sp. Obi]|nr:probable Ankyrin-3 [Coccomyxa sp. Obi]
MAASLTNVSKPASCEQPAPSAFDMLCKAAASGDIAGAVAQMEGTGIEVNVADEQGWTPLHTAVQAEQCEMVCWLLENGASPTVETSQGVTPLSLAEEAGNSDLADLLQEWVDSGEVKPRPIHMSNMS